MAVGSTMSVEAPKAVTLVNKSSPGFNLTKNSDEETNRWIVQSPYTEKSHQLDLGTLDFENAVLAEALMVLKAVHDDYATAPYDESFNWSEVVAEMQRIIQRSGRKFSRASFYVVAFRSQIKPSTEYSHLGELDKAAHAEAVASGGFLK